MEALRNAVSGFALSCRGYALIVSHRSLLARYLMTVLRTLLAASAIAALLFFPLLILRPIGIVIAYELVLRGTCSAMLFSAQLTAPKSVRGLFWLALSVQDEAVASKIERLPILRGFGATLFSLLQYHIFGAVALAAFGASLPLWLPVLFTSVMAFVYTSPLVLLSLLPLALGLTVLVASGAHRDLMAMLSAFSTLSNLAPAALAAALVVAASCGLVPWSALDTMVRAAMFGLACSAFAQQSLAQYSSRQDASAWKRWAGARTWLLAGFGVPGCVVVRYAHPLAGLAMLELTHGAAATLLAAELAKADPTAREVSGKGD